MVLCWGLIVELQSEYVITSNRESGFGRYDVILEPKNAQQRDAILLEFKVHDPEEASLLETVQAARKQIEEKRYDTVLLQRGDSGRKNPQIRICIPGETCPDWIRCKE